MTEDRTFNRLLFFFIVVLLSLLGTIFWVEATRPVIPESATNPPIQAKMAPELTSAQESPSLVDSIKREEGFRSKPYRDKEGVLTIGYGLNLTTGITRSEAEWLLRSRLDHARHCLERDWEPYYRMTSQTQDALVSMAYQLGCTGLMGFTDMLSALEQGDCPKAKAEALDSAWARETPERAERVSERLCSP